MPQVDERIERMREILARPVGLMPGIGNIIAESCVRAFQAQRLGDIPWPARYPRQGTPKLNIAGVVQDFIEGRREPKANRFVDRPAAVDTGGLRDSVESKIVDDFTVTVGSDHPKAELMHAGGTSVQNYGLNVQQAIRDWLYERDAKGRQKVRQGRGDYVQYLNRLLRRTSLTTRVNARPFIGLTDAAERKIRQYVVRYFEERVR